MSTRRSGIRAVLNTLPLMIALTGVWRGSHPRIGFCRQRHRYRRCAAAGSDRARSAAARRLRLGCRTLGVEWPLIRLDIRDLDTGAPSRSLGLSHAGSRWGTQWHYTAGHWER